MYVAQPHTRRPPDRLTVAQLAVALTVSLLSGCTEDLGPSAVTAPAATLTCHVVACDVMTGTCVEVPDVDGTACDDQSACTTDDHCVAGTCIASALSCDDGNACTTDGCDPATGCVAAALSGDACDDRDACTTADACVDGVCAGSAVTCGDDDVCTTDACDPQVGCVATPVAGAGDYCGGIGAICPVGFACRDGQFCESCAGGELYVPQGRFWMGCNALSDANCAADEAPQHRVVVAAFAIQRTEVTAADYERCVNDTEACEVPTSAGLYGTYGVPERANHPVTPVSWNQANDYCAWLDTREATAGGDDWRLCSEAEWEKAARGSCEVHCERADDDACCQAAMPVFPWGDEAASCTLAIMNDGGNGCGSGITLPAGSRPSAPSVYGALDLAGNAREWVQDCYRPGYEDAPTDGAPAEGAACGPSGRVVRGGSAGDTGRELRASERYFLAPDLAYDFYGFRCCRSLR